MEEGFGRGRGQGSSSFSLLMILTNVSWVTAVYASPVHSIRKLLLHDLNDVAR